MAIIFAVDLAVIFAVDLAVIFAVDYLAVIFAVDLAEKLRLSRNVAPLQKRCTFAEKLRLCRKVAPLWKSCAFAEKLHLCGKVAHLRKSCTFCTFQGSPAPASRLTLQMHCHLLNFPDVCFCSLPDIIELAVIFAVDLAVIFAVDLAVIFAHSLLKMRFFFSVKGRVISARRSVETLATFAAMSLPTICADQETASTTARGDSFTIC